MALPNHLELRQEALRIHIQWNREGKGLGSSEFTPSRILTFPVSAIPGPNLISYSVLASSSSPLGVPRRVRDVR